ncbi:hypothetical protein K353_02795 [Kitasatospora sp. SolWspMP-SS2h]|uniref:hypothetical protein n=1 Tax=Kitasatospora sp. SolWspMP-SS2h TaxID=1305729 RepID=UPI000DBA9889|nr:hypothetical protein [Kitasatospora sp. SolWspMP-SS2h]RAJ41684.1 hypothetical protein K353_02795 [Kitasatospora sp. SolWspMP-SS2h]
MPAPSRSGEPRTAAPDVRLVRAAAFAGASAVLGSAGHAAACGSSGWAAIGAGWLFLFSGAWVAAGRRRGPVAIVGASVLGQVLLHLLLVLAAVRPAPPVGAAPPVGVTADHLDHARLSGGMLLAHVLAALAVGVLLHRVEAALWRLLGLARRVRATVRRRMRQFAALLAVLVRGPVRRPSAAACPVPRYGRRLGVLLIGYAVVRRGPPVAGCARS